MELAFIDAEIGRGNQLWVTLSADRACWIGAIEAIQKTMDTGETYAHIMCTWGRASGTCQYIKRILGVIQGEKIEIIMPEVVYLPLINTLQSYQELVADGRIGAVAVVDLLSVDSLKIVIDKVNEKRTAIQ